MAESPVQLVKGIFTYKKGEEVKTFEFYANYKKCTDTIQLVIQGYSLTVISAAKDLPLTSVNMPGASFMAIELSRMEYNYFITNVLNNETQLPVKDKTGEYKPFPGTWSSEETPKELPPTPNSPSSCVIAGGRRRTRRRKHKRRSTRQRHHRR